MKKQKAAFMNGLDNIVIKEIDIPAVDKNSVLVKLEYIEKIKEPTDGHGTIKVIETAGSPYTIAQTAHLVQKGGTIVLVGLASVEEISYNFAQIMDRKPRSNLFSDTATFTPRQFLRLLVAVNLPMSRMRQADLLRRRDN